MRPPFCRAMNYFFVFLTCCRMQSRGLYAENISMLHIIPMSNILIIIKNDVKMNKDAIFNYVTRNIYV